MKTDEQLVALALEMAEKDGNAVIMFALRTYPEAKHFLSLARFSPSFGTGVMKVAGMAVDYPSGGRVMFRNVTKANVCDYAGYQFSHLFIPRSLHLEAEATLKCWIRSAKHKELLYPMGVYKPYWVERNVSYKESEKER